MLEFGIEECVSVCVGGAGVKHESWMGGEDEGKVKRRKRSEGLGNVLGPRDLFSTTICSTPM